jgi:hypothetical protein
MEQTKNIKDFEKIEMPILSQLLILYESIHKIVFSFSKYERYTLGEKIQNTLLSLIELVIMVNSSNKYEKEKNLLRVSAKIETIKILIRIALNCKLIETEKYLETARKLQEIGKMTQGWIKYTRNSV